MHQENGRDTLMLGDDDPQAVSLMLHYLYHLDYPEAQASTHKEEGSLRHVSQISSASNHSNTNHLDKNHRVIVDGSQHLTPNAQQPMEYSIEKEQFVDQATSSSPTGTGETSSEVGSKKSKKKKRRSIPTETSPEAASTHGNATQTQTQTQIQTQEPLPSSSATASTNTPTITTVSPTAPQPQPSSLTIHARLYALASKYGVEGLAALAADKFERGVGQHWGTEDFLRAAREAYTSTDRADRRLRDAVLGAIKAHPELLGRTAVQDAIRGLELSFDLLMHMRGGSSNGVAAGSV